MYLYNLIDILQSNQFTRKYLRISYFKKKTILFRDNEIYAMERSPSITINPISSKAYFFISQEFLKEINYQSKRHSISFLISIHFYGR
jgi:hypothetical protein